jgi:hypothetical protein
MLAWGHQIPKEGDGWRDLSFFHLRCGFGHGNDGMQHANVEPALRAVQLLGRRGTLSHLLQFYDSLSLQEI